MEDDLRPVEVKKNSVMLGNMSTACRYCVRGRKLVMFVTGVCPRNCYYCPLSSERKNKDVIFANERPIENLDEIIEEAKLSGAKGAGITGGDPLARLDRTIKIIKMLKKEFGERFNIHLYTSLDLVDEKKIKMLEDAGLDEIRFHPDFEDKSLWHKMSIKTKMLKSVEIPVIPGMKKEILELMDFIKDKVQNVQLNEFEITETNAKEFEKRGFVTKDEISYAIKGSEELAKEIIEYCRKNTKLNVLYCSAKLKDTEQLRNRILVRAKIVAKPYDKVTFEGTLIRGAIYLPNILPEFGYERKLKELRKDEKILKVLEDTRQMLIKKLKISPDKIEVDKHKLRLLTSKAFVKKFKKNIKNLNLVPAIVEEHPTYDEFEVESEYLN